MRIALRAMLLFFAAVFAVQFAKADDPLAPTLVKGAQVITVEQARELVGKAQFFDVRPPVEYGKGHIKGAASLVYRPKSAKTADFDPSNDTFDIAKLPKDKSSPIVFYSDGPHGWRSYKAAVAASRAKHSDVKWMREGLDGWLAKGGTLE